MSCPGIPPRSVRHYARQRIAVGVSLLGVTDSVASCRDNIHRRDFQGQLKLPKTLKPGQF